MCTACLYVQFSVSVKFMRSRLCMYLRMFVNASRCLWLWYLKCHCWSTLIIFTIVVGIYLLNSCCKCCLDVDGTTPVLTIPLGFSCPNGQWQYYSASPRFAILFSLLPLGVTIPWAHFCKYCIIVFQCISKAQQVFIASVKKTHVWHLTELCELFTYINEIVHVVMA